MIQAIGGARSGTRNIERVVGSQVTRRAPEHGLTVNQANGDARSGTRNVERVVVFQVARRAPESGFTKMKANGGAAPQNSLSEVAAGSCARDSPTKAREACCCVQVTRRAPEHGFTWEPVQRGPRSARRSFRAASGGSCARDLRGLATPAGVFIPRRGVCGGRFAATQITSTAGGAGARERGAPQSPVGVAGCAQITNHYCPTSPFCIFIV
jgi:hypothetical protein